MLDYNDVLVWREQISDDLDSMTSGIRTQHIEASQMNLHVGYKHGGCVNEGLGGLVEWVTQQLWHCMVGKLSMYAYQFYSAAAGRHDLCCHSCPK